MRSCAFRSSSMPLFLKTSSSLWDTVIADGDRSRGPSTIILSQCVITAPSIIGMIEFLLTLSFLITSAKHIISFPIQNIDSTTLMVKCPMKHVS